MKLVIEWETGDLSASEVALIEAQPVKYGGDLAAWTQAQREAQADRHRTRVGHFREEYFDMVHVWIDGDDKAEPAGFINRQIQAAIAIKEGRTE